MLKKPTKRNISINDLNDSWCKSDNNKACVFSKYLESTFQPFYFNNDDSNITTYLDIRCQMDFPTKHIRPKEVVLEISKLNNKKTPGYDKIGAKDIKLFPKKAVLYLTLIYNLIMRSQYFPLQWKCAEILMVPVYPLIFFKDKLIKFIKL